MKKSLTVLSTALLLFCSSLFASDGDTVPAKVKNAFEKQFLSAMEVSWEKSSDLYFARFKLHDLAAEAVYNESGDLMSTSRKVTFGNLPLKVSMAVTQKYKGYTIAETAREIIADDETRYSINVENDMYTLILLSNSNGDITVNNKIKK